MTDYLRDKRRVYDRLSLLRETWLQNVADFGLEYRIFKGRGDSPGGSDEVILDCSDEYFASFEKIKAICKWAHEREYDYICKIDDDSFVYLDRLLSSGFEKYDYSGRAGQTDDYVPGGPAYWLSNKAINVVANTRFTNIWQEDVFVGKALQLAGITGYRDKRYEFGGSDVYIDLNKLVRDDYIALTACDPPVMKKLYNDWLRSRVL